MAQQPPSPPVGQGLSIEASRSHTQGDPPHLLGLLWTSDRLDAKVSNRQHKHSQETYIYAPDVIRIRGPVKRATTGLNLSPRGHWDRPMKYLNKRDVPLPSLRTTI
jgi:hypothetical protein